MQKFFTILFFNILILNVLNAQDYISLGDAAVKSGKYQSAIDYYQSAYEQNPSDDITKKMNFAQNLKKEFDAIDVALASKNTELAEQHINNVLMIDPTNTFVETKRAQIVAYEEKAKKNKQAKFKENYLSGFKGDDDKHDRFGGFHYRCGGGAGSDFDETLTTDLYYNNSILIPFTLEVGFAWDEFFYTDATLNYSILNRSSLDLGGGYSNEGAYFKVGYTLMFDGEGWGGFNYSYKYGNYLGSYHTISYTFGRKPTGWLTYGVILLGLLIIAS